MDSTTPGGLKRQAPSPLTFHPDHVLQPAQPVTSAARNVVNMPHVKRNITRRLKLAKQECDVALQKIINNITQFIEEQIRAKQLERESAVEDSYLASSTSVPLQEPFELLSDDTKSAAPAFLQPEDAASDDGGYEAELEGKHSRQPSVSSSPSSLRKNANLPISRSTAELSPRKSSGASSIGVNAPISTSPSTWSPGAPSHIARRLSRSIHIPIRTGSSSRSTSRSRSPMPPSNTAGEQSASTSPRFAQGESLSSSVHSNRRHSRAFFEEQPPQDPFIQSLHELTAIATDICEASISSLTSQPKACHELISKVRGIGNAWDEHPEWPGRSWHMQVLLALASLTRVVEWWEAESKFWNFEDGTDDKEGDEESFMFVFKPEVEDGDSVKTPAAAKPLETELEKDRLAVKNEAFQTGRFSPSPSKLSGLVGRRSRDEMSGLRPMTNVNEPTARDSEQLSKFLSLPSGAQATEMLRERADIIKSTTIVLQIALDGEQILDVNQAWQNVVGIDHDDVLSTNISNYLHHGSLNIFKEASKTLQQEGGGRAAEINFRIQVLPDVPEADYPSHHPMYCEMEGRGMLMYEKREGTPFPSHTLWVLKSVAPPEVEEMEVEIEVGQIGDDPTSAEVQGNFKRGFVAGSNIPVTPFPLQHPINTSLILCRICECKVPEWYFERHSDSCNDVHKLEADIADCNETISELRSTVRDLYAVLEKDKDRDAQISGAPEYRGIPIFTPGASPSASSPLQMFRPHMPSRMQREAVRKLQLNLLERLENILQVAVEISTPGLKDEDSKEPVELMSLLSPTSESKLERVRNWNRPTTEDPALTRLVLDTEKVMMAKLDNVLRMKEKIRYSETSRRVWEASVEQQLSKLDEETEEDTESSGNASAGDEESKDVPDIAQDVAHDEESLHSHSSTTSEYAFGKEDSYSAPTPTEPTPMASTSPAFPATVHPSPLSHSRPSSILGMGSAWSSTRSSTRASTPSSVSSPLALAVPITAEPPYWTLSPEPDLALLQERERAISGHTIRPQNPRHSFVGVEPHVTLTPPLSPMMSPTDSLIKDTTRHSRRHSTAQTAGSSSASLGPMSPRLPSVAPSSRTTPPSLKDFDIVKPISKGAFGSVYLAKKKSTGDYFAIKVLKKADMITKNQVTNVKHERMILMRQAESPFVVKLFFTFQSKDNLYLVMEYLNGGDCAVLIKSLGALPEEWTRNYIAEVVLGLEYLHKRGIVHRDLKPDNLLIDQHGHLKLTDFGLSRIGLLNRQQRDATVPLERSRSTTRSSAGSRPPSIDTAILSSPLIVAELGMGSYFNQRTNSHSAPHLAANTHLPYTPDDISESSGSDSFSGLFWKRGGKPGESPLQSFATDLTNDLRIHSGLNTAGLNQKFVGTPDYLAPESILGISGDDPAVDWWALGVITYEFLYGIPPFHADTPEKVFAKILSGQIDWDDDYVEISSHARDFMEKLMTSDPSKRLGSNGASEIRAHSFFTGVEWDKVTTQEAQFIPQVTDPESTDYFDPRGALPKIFQEEEEPPPQPTDSPGSEYLSASALGALPAGVHESLQSPGDDFGNFSFKNLPVLKQANDDVIRKLKTESKTSVPLTPAEPSLIRRKKSLSQRRHKPPSVMTGVEKPQVINPPSPSTSVSSVASSPSRASQAPPTPAMGSHLRRPSEHGAVERLKRDALDGEARRNSMPSRLRTTSISSVDVASSDSSEPWRTSNRSSGGYDLTPATSMSLGYKKTTDAGHDRAVTCLLAEDNPISQKILETVLTRMGCRCVLAVDGAEVISIALGDTKFDCVLMDLHMPIVDGEQAARYIKTTPNKNSDTPIVAVSAYSGQDSSLAPGDLFTASLSKPVARNELLAVMRQLGFKTTAQEGSRMSEKVVR